MYNCAGACSSAAERPAHNRLVAGSITAGPTKETLNREHDPPYSPVPGEMTADNPSLAEVRRRVGAHRPECIEAAGRSPAQNNASMRKWANALFTGESSTHAPLARTQPAQLLRE